MTLLESLAATGLTTIVLALGLDALVTSSRLARAATTDLVAAARAHQVAEVLGRELRDASRSSIACSTTGIRFTPVTGYDEAVPEVLTGDEVALAIEGEAIRRRTYDDRGALVSEIDITRYLTVAFELLPDGGVQIRIDVPLSKSAADAPDLTRGVTVVVYPRNP